MTTSPTLRDLIVYYGSHRVFLRLARNTGVTGEELAKMERCVDWAMADIERELKRLGVKL